MTTRLDAVLDARPRWADRWHERLRARLAHDVAARRRWLTGTVVLWQLGEWVAPRRQVAPVRRVLLAMVVLDSVATYVWVTSGVAVEGNPLVASVMSAYGDGPGLVLRTLWSAALVVALTWLAERRAAVRPALLIPLAALGAVTVLHAAVLGWAWRSLLGA